MIYLIIIPIAIVFVGFLVSVDKEVRESEMEDDDERTTRKARQVIWRKYYRAYPEKRPL